MVRFNNLKRELAQHYLNLPGWRTSRKLMVIESDDWGSIRMPCRDVYEACIKNGYPVDQNPYERFDTLLSEEDLTHLFDLLGSYKDFRGNHPVITANCVVANPDFDRIREEDFQSYHFETIKETFQSYPRHHNNVTLWQKGMEAGVFHPQFHGREHLNVHRFMEALGRGDKDVHFGFNHRMPGCISKLNGSWVNLYMDAMRYETQEEKRQIIHNIKVGLDLFQKIFGYRSASFIPPNYTWSPDHDKELRGKEVRYIQGIRKLREPEPRGGMKYHTFYLGKRTSSGLIHLVRNVHFEPSLFTLGITDPADHCLHGMEVAFRMKKPAVISSHRINYAGFIDVRNRDRTLAMWRQIFARAMKKWPDLEFTTSDRLGDQISRFTREHDGADIQ